MQFLLNVHIPEQILPSCLCHHFWYIWGVPETFAWGFPLKTWRYIKRWLQPRCFPVNFSKFFGAPISQNICEQLLLIFGVTFNVWREQLGSFKALQLVFKGFRLNLYLILYQIYSVSILLKHSQWLARPIVSNRKFFLMSSPGFAKLRALHA